MKLRRVLGDKNWRNSKRTHISLSPCRSVDVLWFSRKDVHIPVSLFLSLFKFAKTVWIQIRPDGIRQLKICAWCDRKYAKCRTKADAHDKMVFQYISISVYIVRSHARIQRGTGGVSLAGRWWPAFSDFWILSPLNKKEKNVVRVRIQIRSEWNSGNNVSSI